jgi:hypothetical protein
MARKSLKTKKQAELRMPGFNAEASLYASSASYRSAEVSSGNDSTVRPAVDFGDCTSEFCRLVVYHGNLACICRFPP